MNYYEGRLNEFPNKSLSKEEKMRVIHNYNEEDEIPDIFNFKEK